MSEEIIGHPPAKKTDKTSTRTTIFINDEILDSVKALAYWERTTIKNVIEDALNQRIAKTDPKTLKQATEAYRETQKKNIVD